MEEREIGSIHPLKEVSVEQLQESLNFADRMTKIGAGLFLAGLGAAAGSLVGVERASKDIAPFTFVGSVYLILVGGFITTYRDRVVAIISEIEARGLQVKGKSFFKRIELTEIPIDPED